MEESSNAIINTYDSTSSPEYINTDSWSEMVDSHISGVIENKLLTSTVSQKEKIIKTQNHTTYNMADIISKNPCDINDVTLLEWGTYISSQLKKYIKNCADNKNNPFDYNLHIPKFEWLLNMTKILSGKLGLPITYHKLNQHNDSEISLPRSSYKFCEYNYECQFNYKHNKNVGCYAQHYVHNLVHSDIKIMMDYLKYINDINENYDYNELIKCITTISYVIKHMYEELSNIQFHNGESKDLHMEKSKVVHKKRNNRRNKNNHM